MSGSEGNGVTRFSNDVQYRHLGLEESKITGHSNKREKIARLSRRVPKGSKLKTRITNAWSQEEIDLCSL